MCRSARACEEVAMVDDLHIPLGPFIAVVITISMIGFVTGTSGPSGQWKQKRTTVPVSAQSSEVPTARSYTQMRQTARGQVTWPSPSPGHANSTISPGNPTPKPSETPDKAALQRYLGAGAPISRSCAPAEARSICSGTPPGTVVKRARTGRCSRAGSSQTSTRVS